MNFLSGNPANLRRGRIVNDSLMAAFQFPHVADLYAPVDLSLDANNAVADSSWPSVPTVRGVRCFYNATTNVNSPMMAGNMKMANIFTDDRWYFDASSPVSTGWIIRMRRAGHPLYGDCFVVQGPLQVINVPGMLQLPIGQVYAILTPTPAGMI